MEFGDYREAQAAISGVLRQNPKSGEAWNIQGSCWRKMAIFPGDTRV
jgi:tight adherence protein D